jgi:hypothetical protein
MALACHGCSDQHKKLPPADDEYAGVHFPAPLHVHLLPYLEQDAVYKTYVRQQGEGDAITAFIPTYASPEDHSLPPTAEGVQDLAANLRVFSNKGFGTRYDADMPDLAAVEPGGASIPDSFPRGLSTTIAFATKFAVCAQGGSRYAAAPDSDFAAFFGQNAAQVAANPTDVAVTFQLNPSKADCRCRPLLAQSFSSVGITVALMDGSVRMVSADMSARTWNLAAQPNHKLALGDDWAR